MSIGLVDNEGSSGISIRVPMMLKRRSGRKEIIVPDRLENAQDSGPNYHDALVIAISRAHRWKKLLDEGRYGSIAEMSIALKINRYYLARLLRLTLLAPEIVEAILDCREPDGLTLNRLVGAIGLLWDKQMKDYGLLSRT